MSKQLSIFGLFPPRVNVAQLEADAEDQRREARARATIQKRKEERGILTLTDCWKLLKVPRGLRPEDIQIVPLSWGGWRLRACWMNEGFSGYVSTHSSVVGLKGDGFDDIDLDDLDGITQALIKGLKAGTTYGKCGWTFDETMWLAWLKARNDLKEGGGDGR